MNGEQIHNPGSKFALTGKTKREIVRDISEIKKNSKDFLMNNNFSEVIMLSRFNKCCGLESYGNLSNSQLQIQNPIQYSTSTSMMFEMFSYYEK